MYSCPGKQYILKNGAKILVVDDLFYVIDETGHFTRIKYLNPTGQKIINLLLEAKGEVVEYEELYKSYPHKKKSDDGLEIQEALQRVKGNSMDKELRAQIKASPNKGYYFPIESLEDVAVHTVIEAMDDSSKKSLSPEFALMEGEYYTFYIDPVNNQLLGGYIHIQNLENNMIVHAILDIRNTDDLLQVPDIFSVKDNFFSHIEFQNYKKINGSNLYVGKFGKCSDYVAAITLKRKIDLGSWQIILNLKDFMTHPRDYTKENNLYRGGLGLKLGGHTDNVSACRIALIRKSLFDAKCMGLSSEDLREFLTTKDGYVNISAESDKKFYLWLRGHYPDLDD